MRNVDRTDPFRLLFAFFLLAGLLCPAIDAADDATSAASETPIRLRSGELRGPGDAAGLPERLRLDGAALAHGGPALLRLRAATNPEQRAHLEAAGVRLFGYLGGDTFIAWLPEGGLDLADSLQPVDWAAPYHPGLRISPALLPPRVDDLGPRLAITVHLFAHAEVDAVLDRLRELDLDTQGFSPGREATQGRAGLPGRIVVLAEPRRWAETREKIAAWPEVLWIGRRPAYRLLNDVSDWVGQSGLHADQARPVFDHGLYGEGQTIAILDTGLDADMCFFRPQLYTLPPTNVGFGVGNPDEQQRKVTIVNFLALGDDPGDPSAWDTHDHGTHVAGSAAGDRPLTLGVRDPGDGMAPAAKLVIQDAGFAVDDCADMPAIGCPAADLYPFFEQAYLQGARIHSNSYGDRENFTPHDLYSEGSQAADAFVWDHPDMLLLFAAGNGGPGPGTVISPATGKNVVAVGATLNGYDADELASFSSWGATHDGRIKPDVTAPGSSIVSADNDQYVRSNNCGTRTMSGTSMATPTAAGLAALVREYYTKGFYPTGGALPAHALTPSAALLKATLIASATPMAELADPPPSIEQGWGRILLDDALYFAGDSRRLYAVDHRSVFSSPTDPAEEHRVTVESSETPLRVVLTWTDYPSTPAASVNLVNDLDLEVRSPDGELFLGNVFLDGVSVSGGEADRVNNVEVVRVHDPRLGAWTIRVVPHAVPQPVQGYAVVATGAMPVGGTTGRTFRGGPRGEHPAQPPTWTERYTRRELPVER